MATKANSRVRGRTDGSTNRPPRPGARMTANEACARQQHVEEAAHWSRRGLSVAAIARSMDIEQDEVVSLLRSAEVQYRQAAVLERAVGVGEQIFQLRDATQEVLEAWERSKQDHTKTVTEEEPVVDCALCEGTGQKPARTVGRKAIPAGKCHACGGKGKQGGVVRVTRTVEGRLPDPTYMQLFLRSLERMASLCGLDAPKQTINKNDNTNSDQWNVLVSVGGQPPQDRVRARIDALLAQGAAVSAPVPPTQEGDGK